MICTGLQFIAPFHNFSGEDVRGDLTALYNCLTGSNKDENAKLFPAGGIPRDNDLWFGMFRLDFRKKNSYQTRGAVLEPVTQGCCGVSTLGNFPDMAIHSSICSDLMMTSKACRESWTRWPPEVLSNQWFYESVTVYPVGSSDIENLEKKMKNLCLDHTFIYIIWGHLVLGTYHSAMMSTYPYALSHRRCQNIWEIFPYLKKKK